MQPELLDWVVLWAVIVSAVPVAMAIGTIVSLWIIKIIAPRVIQAISAQAARRVIAGARDALQEVDND